LLHHIALLDIKGAMVHQSLEIKIIFCYF